MHSSQPLSQTPVAPPWQEKQVSSGAKFGLLVVSALLLIVLLVSLFIVIGVSGELARGRTAPQNVTSNLIAVGVTFVLFVGSLFGLIVIWPYTRATTRVTPSYGAIPATTSGHPFEAQFHRYIWARSMRGKGTVQFDADGLTFAGHLEPSGLFQIGIVLLVTFLPLLLFGIGVGIIPALIIAYYVGRKKVSHTVPYSELRDLQVKGSRVTFRRVDAPKQVTFAVAQADGERLYRELLPRFPATLGGWVG
jgi:hypothetical protein